MKLERSIPEPDLWPTVPHRLAMKLQAYFERTEKIEIQLSMGRRRWERVNTVFVSDEEAQIFAGLTEAERIEALDRLGSLVKACADAHATEVGRSCKYRAVLVRKVGETDLRRATFDVDLELEAQRRQPKGIQWSRSGNPWADIVAANQALAEVMVRFNERVMDQLLEQQRIRRAVEDRAMLKALFHELEAVCEEGLRMQAETAREITEERVQERLAQARAQVDEQRWELLTPVLEMAVAWIRDRLERAHGSGGEANGSAEESEAERTEGAPPSTGDAPSSGKDESGE